MSTRIEHTDPTQLLSQLPDQWAQTCITSPPHTLPSTTVLTVLGEVHRVLRPDGTLWLLTRGDQLRDDLQNIGFHPQRAPHWATAHTSLRAHLFSTSAHFFTDRTLLQPRLPGTRPHRAAARARCAREQLGLLTRLCVLVGSAPLACGVCGAPYQHPGCPGGRAPQARRPPCEHSNRAGRCLILDPFYRPDIPTLQVACRYRRSFLAITGAPK